MFSEYFQRADKWWCEWSSNMFRGFNFGWNLLWNETTETIPGWMGFQLGMVVWWGWFRAKTIHSQSHLLLIFLGLVWRFVFLLFWLHLKDLPALFSLLSPHRLLLPFHNLSSCLIPLLSLELCISSESGLPCFPPNLFVLVTDGAVREELQRWCSWWCRALPYLEQTQSFGSVSVCLCIYFFLLKVTGISQTWSPADFIAPDSWLGFFLFLQEKMPVCKMLVLGLVCCLGTLLYSGACLFIHPATLSRDLRIYLKSLNVALLALRWPSKAESKW